MSKISRRLGSAVAAVAVAGGIGLATTTPAQAYDLVSHYSASDVRQVRDTIDADVSLCGLALSELELGDLVCFLSGNSEMSQQFHTAADQGCGLDVYVTATGSAMSYDKAEYDYALVC